MKLKTPTTTLQLGEWTNIKGHYWFRQDLSEFNSDWAEQFGHNNAVGFLVSKIKDQRYCLPRFFGSDVNFLIEEWDSFTQRLPSDIEKAKETMDKFLELINK